MDEGVSGQTCQRPLCPSMENKKLSAHFSLFDMTATSWAQFKEKNRRVSDFQIEKLAKLADLFEKAREIIEAPIVISSGYRCADLNRAVGSTDRSQHRLCEAADGVPRSITVLQAFGRLKKAAREKRISFGQLIFEQADRGYAGGVVSWFHLSLGAPYRPKERCGQILTMCDGNYSLIEQIKGA